jgi:hypothetical protein
MWNIYDLRIPTKGVFVKEIWANFANWYLTQTRKRVIIARNDGIYLGNWHPAFGADED